MGYRARATHGQDGRVLWGGLDMSGGITPININEIDTIRTIERPDYMFTISIEGLSHKPTDSVKMMAQLLKSEGFNDRTECKFGKNKTTFFVDISNRHFRARGYRFIEMPKDI